MSDLNPLIGKRIVAVYLAKDGGAIKFDIDGFEPVIARADGDCCSHTWIEHVESPEYLLGNVAAVENVPMPDLGSPRECKKIAYYGCNIGTEKGSCLIDYRNASNGYYGGRLVWPGEDFDGGVFRQNVSKEEWERIAP